MTVSSVLVRNRILAPAMESLCHNLAQYDPSPAIDSDLERLKDALNRGDNLAAHHYCDRVIESNILEGEATGEAAGNSDQLVTELHGLETAGSEATFATKAICRRLRDALKVVRDPQGCSAREITFAHQIVKETVKCVPASELLKPSVKRELGDKLTATLEWYVDGVQA